MNKKSTILTAVLSAFLCLTGLSCFDDDENSSGGVNSPIPSDPVSLTSKLVTTDWLNENLSKSGLVVVDVRGADAYAAGHIPNSVNIPFAPVSDWAINSTDGTLMVEIPDMATFATALGQKGISNASSVVLVGGPISETDPYALAAPTRAALTLAYAGLNSFAILDGGYAKWVAENKTVNTDASTLATSTFTPTTNASMFVKMADVQAAITNPAITIIDARDPAVYNGEIDEPWSAGKLGHIQTALSFPAVSVWTQTEDYKTFVELTTIATNTVGTDKTKEIIVHCGVGGYASSVWFALTQLLGYTNVKVYDGSAQEWVLTNEMVNSQIPSDPVSLTSKLVTTDWLNKNLSKSGLVVVDVRGADAYATGHIPNSVNIPFAPVSDWATNSTDGSLMVEIPDMTTFSAALGQKGISNTSSVVLVCGPISETDPYALSAPTRAALTLAYAGLNSFAILDGGYAKWVAEAKTVSTTASTIVPSTFTPAPNATMFVGMNYVKTNANGATIVDARDSVVYNAEVIEPFANKAGHIPGAISLPAPSAWTETETYKTTEELTSIATSAVGADKTKEIVIYCGVGGYASTVWFTLTQILGYTNVKVYDGSAQEWVLTNEMVIPSAPVSLTSKLVTTDWLNENLSKSGLVVVDVRGTDAYAAGHIPNSVNIPFAPVSAWATNSTDGSLMVEIPDMTTFSAALGQNGISNASSVILVCGPISETDPYALSAPTRAALTLAYAGLNSFAILDGGYAKWVAENKTISTDASTLVPSTFTPAPNATMFVDMNYVKTNANGATIVDARDSVVYNAEVVEPFANKAGHIPGAISLPAPSAWTETETYKTTEELTSIATSAVGADKTKEIVIYCGVGGYASTVWFTLTQILGYTNVKVYDGSAQEWVLTNEMINLLPTI